MSLPEELPLLNCKELQHHLLQVHTRLNTPAVRLSTDGGPADANSASVTVIEPETSRTDQHAKGRDVSLQTQSVQSAVTEQVKPTKSPLADEDFLSQSPVDKGDWANAGLCPLNPFMVPVALLKRQ